MKPADWLAVARYLSLITGIGLSFIAPVLLGWWLGRFLQSRLLWDGWFLIALLAGISAGVSNVYLLLRKVISRE